MSITKADVKCYHTKCDIVISHNKQVFGLPAPSTDSGGFTLGIP